MLGSSPLARGLPVRADIDVAACRIIPARAGFTFSRRCSSGYRRGSSPLARGLLPFTQDDVTTLRIIPARAGFTVGAHEVRQLRQDHPRSRGVYSVTRPVMNAVGRIIPARAGFTRCCRWLSASWPDHPRSRGVYRTTRVSRPHPTGLSPLARGLQAHNPPVYHTNRIIPARAGFTSTENLAQKIAADHPRSRGVYEHRESCPEDRRGSSPLARGLQINELTESNSVRIIPARAGFTAVTTPSHVTTIGSSPLARGLRRHVRSRAPSARIIPARAGFTHRRVAGNVYGEDHPRSRGVYPSSESSADDNAGSSPLARGLLSLGSGEEVWAGIIPARAGFTLYSPLFSRRCRDHPRSRGVYGSGLGRRMCLGRIIPARAGFTISWRCRLRGRSDHPRSRGVY